MKIKYFDITDQGLSVKCKLYHNDQHRFSDVVISCHGFGGDKDNAATQKLAETLLPVQKEAAVLAFDWPCHGNDVKQRLDLEDCGRYLDVVLEYAREQLGAERLYAFATSFGGYVTLKYLFEKDDPFCRVSLRCPAVNMYEILMNDILEKGQADQLRKKDALVGHDRKIRVSQKFLDQLKSNDITAWDFSAKKGNLLILQGTKDELVSCAVVEAFAERNGIDFLPVEGADHRFREPSKIREVLDYTMEHFFG